MRELLVLITLMVALAAAALVFIVKTQEKAQVPCEAAGGELVRSASSGYVCVQPLIIIKKKVSVIL